MKRRILGVFLALFLCTSLPPDGRASVVPVAPGTSKVVRVGYYNAGRMMFGASPMQRKAGWAYEYLRHLIEYADWRYEYVFGSYDELMGKLERGEIDILPCVLNAQRYGGAFFYPDNPSFAIEYTLASLRNETRLSNDMSWLQGRSVGVLNDGQQAGVLSSWLTSHRVRLNVVPYTSDEERLRDLREGRIDLIVVSDVDVPAGLRAVDSIGRISAYTIVSPAREDLLADLNQAQADMARDMPSHLLHIQAKALAAGLARNHVRESDQAWLDTRKHIRIGGLIDDAPYTFAEASGRIIGVVPQYLQMLFQRLGVQNPLDWQLYPTMQELRAALRDGDVDLITPEYHDFHDAEKNQQLISRIAFPVTIGMILPKGGVKCAAQRIAVTDTGIDAQYVRDFYPDAALVPCGSVAECIDKVLKGDADSAVGRIAALQKAIRDSSVHSKLERIVLPSGCDVSFACRLSDAPLIRMLNKGISLVREDEINALMQRFTTFKKQSVSLKDFLQDNQKIGAVCSALIVLVVGVFVFQVLAGRVWRRQLRIVTRQRKEIVASHRALSEAKKQLEEESRAKNDYLERLVLKRTSELSDRNRQLVQMSGETIDFICEMVEWHDAESARHIKRMKGLVAVLARQVMMDCPEYGLEDRTVNFLSSGAALHDIGKVMIPDSILQKPGGLSSAEEAVMRTHCEKGRILLGKAPRGWNPEFLELCKDICEFHHERWDGLGYPRGLKGDAIPVAAQIVAICDRYDELVSPHAGGETLDKDAAIDRILHQDSGAFSDKMRQCMAHCREELKRVSMGIAEDVYDAGGQFNGEHLKGIRVLIVDDDELTREINKEILEAEEAQVTAVGSAEEAIALLQKRENGFDAVVMDIVMPGMDGITATKHIRAMTDSSKASVPIIALTSDATPEMVERCLHAGANDCMGKPMVVADLTRILLACMKNHTARIEQQLADTIKAANTDTLTHVKNIAAYTDKAAEIAEHMHEATPPEFAVVMCDVNSLKTVNDTYGHEAGDIYIKNCCNLICNVFKHSPVYRIGGDEFTVILQGADYANRDKLLQELHERNAVTSAISDVASGRASLASGMATYDPLVHGMLSDVVKQADAQMYKDKRSQKVPDR